MTRALFVGTDSITAFRTVQDVFVEFGIRYQVELLAPNTPVQYGGAVDNVIVQ